MGGSTKTVSGVPSDISGLRNQLIAGIAGGGMKQPNMDPSYTQNPMFRPSQMTRGQAMATPMFDSTQKINGVRAVTPQNIGGGTESAVPGGGMANMLSQLLAGGGGMDLSSMRQSGGSNSPLDLSARLNAGAGGNYANLFAQGPGGDNAQSMNGGVPTVYGDSFAPPAPGMESAVGGNFRASSMAPGSTAGTQPTAAPWVPDYKKYTMPGTYNDLGYAVDGKGISYDLKTGNTLSNAERQRRITMGPQAMVAQSNNTQDLLNSLFAHNPAGPPAATIADLPGLDVAQIERIAGPQAASINIDPQLQGLLDQIRGSATQSLGGGGGGGGYSPVNIKSVAGMVQSADQIAGADSPFMKTLMDKYNAQADQNNALALAQAKESAGNLTGSGLGRILGNTMNRSIADRNAKFADVLQNLTSQEINRQMGVAGMEQNKNISEAQINSQMATAAQQLGLQAVQSGRRDLMDIANVLYSRAQGNAANQQQAEMARYGAETTRATNQAGMEQDANNRYFSAGVDRNTNQANMDQARWLAQFSGANDLSSGNANRAMQFLSSLLNTGVGPDTQVQSGGIGAMLPSLLQLAGTIYSANKSASKTGTSTPTSTAPSTVRGLPGGF